MDEKLKIGTSSTLVTFLFGSAIGTDQTIQENIIFWLQATAFLISILVGILTAIYYIRKLKKNT